MISIQNDRIVNKNTLKSHPNDGQTKFIGCVVCVCYNQQHGKPNDTATLYVRYSTHKNNNKTALNLHIICDSSG